MYMAFTKFFIDNKEKDDYEWKKYSEKKLGVIEKNNSNEYTYVKKYESLDKYSVVLIDKEIGNSQEVNLYSYGIAEDCNRISVDTPEKLREYYENYCKNPSVEKVYVIVSSTNKKLAKEMEMQNYKK